MCVHCQPAVHAPSGDCLLYRDPNSQLKGLTCQDAKAAANFKTMA